MQDYIVLAVVVVLLLLALRPTWKHLIGKGSCCGGCEGCQMPSKPRKLKQKVLGKKVIRIQGMTCSHCAAIVQNALQKSDGISADVNVQTGTATVSYSVPISDAKLRECIENVGYKVTQIS